MISTSCPPAWKTFSTSSLSHSRSSSGVRSMPVGQRIDRRGFLLVGDLHQAQFRPIGVLAHEFGVDADEVVLRQALAQFGQVFGLR